MADGILLYQGPSLIDGAPIIVVATGFKRSSANSKTGAMIQTYILRSGISPTAAIKSGDDVSICGNCPQRGNGDGSGRICYVNVGQGPLAVYKAFQRGAYDFDGETTLFNGRKVRLGTYGDPGAVPMHVWHHVTDNAAGWTGYTHQWRTRPDLKAYCMASVDSPAEHAEAIALGWRTFRVAMPGQEARLASEVLCPASELAGKRLNCAACLACSGGDRRGSIMIPVHGGFAVMANVKRRALA